MTMTRWNVPGTVWVLVWSVVCMLSPAAHAYILPARHYLKQYLKSRSSVQKMHIRQTTTWWHQGRKVSFEERVWIRTPSQIRVERWSQNKRLQVDVWNATEHLQWKKGGTTQRKKRRVVPLYDLFGVEPSGASYGNLYTVLRYMRIFYKGRRKWSRTSDYLEQLNVHLTWFQQTPTVVLGRPFAKGRTTHQFWMHKKHYYPMRYIVGTQKKKAQLDIRFFDYHIQSGRALYPGRIAVYQNGKMTRQTLVSKVDTKVSIPSRLFTQTP